MATKRKQPTPGLFGLFGFGQLDKASGESSGGLLGLLGFGQLDKASRKSPGLFGAKKPAGGTGGLGIFKKG